MAEERRPPADLRERVATALGREPVGWHRPHTGLSAAQRFVVRFADGSGAFVKAAVDDRTEGWLRTEHAIVSTVAGSFVPRPLAWLADGGRPILVMEDLSGAHWPADQVPVTWKPGQFERLFATLRRLAAATPPASLPPAEADFEPQWPWITREAEDFLAQGVCSEAWLRDALDRLIEAEARLSLAGDALVHNDVRSDNLCFLGERLILVDWSGARRGHPELDLANALSTLPLEGGPDPFEVMPGGGAWAAWLAGIAARRAYREAWAPPWLQRVFRRIAAICLAWSARSLDLPPFEGPHWSEIR